MKKLITGAVVGAVVAGGLAVGSGTASARVDSGNYNYVSTAAYGFTGPPLPAQVRGSTITYLSPVRFSRQIIGTPYGGYYDESIARYTFTRTKYGYSGRIYILGIQNGTFRLIKTR